MEWNAWSNELFMNLSLKPGFHMHGKPQTIAECFPNIQDFADVTRKPKRLSQMPFEFVRRKP